MDPVNQGPDETVFRVHIRQGAFLSGERRGRWQLVEIAWPLVLISVRAAQRDKAPDEYTFRFDCANYPASSPTARPWDREKSVPLDPGGWPAGSGRVAAAFNPGWNGGQALYLPCDRLALPGHSDWLTQHRSLLWSPVGDITQYLWIINDLLHSKDYSGLHSA